MIKQGSHFDDAGERHMLALRIAQREFGMSRIKLGLILASIKEHGHWQGRAETFAEFLEENRINDKAARQYMLVAKRLAELGLTEREIEELAYVNMGTLEKACSIMTPANYRDVIDLMTSLSERDAKHELDRIQEPVPKYKRDPKVSKVLTYFRQLPHELRVETMGSLGIHHHLASKRERQKELGSNGE